MGSKVKREENRVINFNFLAIQKILKRFYIVSNVIFLQKLIKKRR
jgi:hypothetical protein